MDTLWAQPQAEAKQPPLWLGGGAIGSAAAVKTGGMRDHRDLQYPRARAAGQPSRQPARLP